jgi:hypothetical protein
MKKRNKWRTRKDDRLPPSARQVICIEAFRAHDRTATIPEQEVPEYLLFDV